MLKIKSKKIGLFIGDFVLLLASLYLALVVRWFYVPEIDVFYSHVHLFLPVFVLLIFFYYIFDFYDFSPFETKLRLFSRITNLHILIGVLGFGYFYIFSFLFDFSPKTIFVLLVILNSIFSVMWRLYISPSFLVPSKRFKALLIANDEEFDELEKAVNNHAVYHFSFVKRFKINKNEEDEEIINNLRKIIDENDISQIVIDIRDEQAGKVLSFLYNRAAQRKIDVFDASLVYQDILKKMPMRGIGHFWFFESVKLDVRAYELTKRFIDILVALPVFVVWICLHPFVYIAIRLEGKGDVFITQERYGLGGKVIKLYKYRTMTFSDKGKWLKDKDNTNKVTKVGYFLRKSRIDELPQVLAIFSGDISIVGPRPDILALGGQLSATIPYYMMRYTVKPGLSGWAQIMQDLPPQSLEETKVRLQYDLYYVKNRSAILDLIIIMRTFKVLILRTGM